MLKLINQQIKFPSEYKNNKTFIHCDSINVWEV